MIFSLYEKPDRLIIDTEPHDSYLLVQSVDAKNWLEAKKLMGFELTPTQEMLLSLS